MPGELIVVGASPGTGKTALGIHFAKTAVKAGYPVGMISVEMSYRALFTRFVAYESYINSRLIRDGELSDEDLQRVAKASETTLNGGIKIIDNITGIDAITAIIRDYTSRLGIKIWVVDYLQLISSKGYRDRRTQVGDIARELMLSAKVMEVPVILLSQLARTS